MSHFGAHWDAERGLITLELTDNGVHQSLTLNPDRAFNLIIMAAKMLRGKGIPYPWTTDEIERITLADVRRHVDPDDVDPPPARPEIELDVVRDCLEEMDEKLLEMNTLLGRMQAEVQP